MSAVVGDMAPTYVALNAFLCGASLMLPTGPSASFWMGVTSSLANSGLSSFSANPRNPIKAMVIGGFAGSATALAIATSTQVLSTFGNWSSIPTILGSGVVGAGGTYFARNLA